MYFQVLFTTLAILQLGSAQQCDLVVTTEEQLREEIRLQIDEAVQRVIENITGSAEQFLDPIIQHLHHHTRLGRSPAHPATSCREIGDKEPNYPPGFY